MNQEKAIELLNKIPAGFDLLVSQYKEQVMLCVYYSLFWMALGIVWLVVGIKLLINNINNRKKCKLLNEEPSFSLDVILFLSIISIVISALLIVAEIIDLMVNYTHYVTPQLSMLQLIFR